LGDCLSSADEVGVSVVIPVCGNSPYLQDALDSAVSQVTTFPFEILVVFQKVTPDYIKFFESYSREYEFVKLVDFPYASRCDSANYGLKIAKYKFVARLDCDDIFEPNRIETHLKTLTKNKNIVLAGSCASIINESGEITRIIRYLKGSFLVNYFAKYMCIIPHSSATFVKEIALCVGGYDKAFEEGGEDFELWSKMRDFGKFHINSSSLIRYRRHLNQQTYIRNLSQIQNDAKTIARNIGCFKPAFSQIVIRDFLMGIEGLHPIKKRVLIYVKSLFVIPGVVLSKILYKVILYIENIK
jgi:glycosyltransferase involved in cell wall biosynthesis